MRPHRIWFRYHINNATLHMLTVMCRKKYGATRLGLGYASTYGIEGKFQYYVKVYY